jgi:polyphenol oxidase
VQSTRRIEEELARGDLPLWTQPEWEARFPWLVQGITGTGREEEPFDLGLFGSQPVGVAMARWQRLQRELGLRSAVHAMQVHGGEVAAHRGVGWHGLLVTGGVDGHLTEEPDLLLTVSVADCVPLALVDEGRRCIALVHAGWRGVAAGIAERAVREILAGGSAPEHLHAHAGPSICGTCYEVGPEVHAAIHPGRETPGGPAPIDLREALATRLATAGVPAEQVTISGHCTRCGPGHFFSHRRGSAARQMSVLGRRS